MIEAGCDEAGRGPLAGPVAAAAVILPHGWEHPLLNDSKQMSEKNRYLLREIIQQQAVAWAVAMVDPEEIDRINILNASFLAMSRAVEQLAVRPQLLLIDGNRFRSKLEIPYRCFVGGDATFASIAAASSFSNLCPVASFPFWFASARRFRTAAPGLASFSTRL